MKNSGFGADFSEEYVEKDWYPIAMDPKMGLINGSNDFPSYNFELAQRDDLYCSSSSPLPAELAVTENQKLDKNLKENINRKRTGESDEMKDNSQINQEVSIEKDENKKEKNKEEIVHLRAKRGQAINSHSLAERVRRKKISERMRLLQDLVPGCSKITAKAVMLDEIINYVQSLQQQVEFLSMKLATVNPDVSLDFDHLLSKQFLVPDQGLVQQEMWYGTSNQIPQITNSPQVAGMWGHEVQNNNSNINTGFISNANPNRFDESGKLL
ncbi:hypothetical protein LUZ60_006195 [Juncus effusus]|nr:hypothetical protein LUZ60_006195 [Juncus effusus]